MKNKETESDPVWSKLEDGDFAGMCVLKERALQKLAPEEEISYLKVLEKTRLARIKITANPNERLQKKVERARPIREAVIKGNFYRVGRLAKCFQDRGVEFVDLMQEGNLGLIEGVDEWRRYPKMTWEQHVDSFIRNKIKKLIYSQGKPYSLTSNDEYVFLNAIRRAKKDLTDGKDIPATASQVTAKINEEYGADENVRFGQVRVTRQSVFELMNYDQRTISLDANYFGKPFHEYGLVGTNFEDEIPSPDDIYESWGRINGWMEQAGLTEGDRGEKRVAALLFGPEGDERRLSYEDAGDIMGISKQRVGVLLKSALPKLEANTPTWAEQFLASAA